MGQWVDSRIVAFKKSRDISVWWILLTHPSKKSYIYICRFELLYIYIHVYCFNYITGENLLFRTYVPTPMGEFLFDYIYTYMCIVLII